MCFIKLLIIYVMFSICQEPVPFIINKVNKLCNSYRIAYDDNASSYFVKPDYTRGVQWITDNNDQYSHEQKIFHKRKKWINWHHKIKT